MNATGRIILLNGVGSVGKTSIARALQKITTAPFLHVQLDTFMDMLPEAYHNHIDGFAYEPVYEDGNRIVVVKTGKFGARVLQGMRHAIEAMASEGNNLIVDDVILGESATAEYMRLLAKFESFLIGIFAPSRSSRRGSVAAAIGKLAWRDGNISCCITGSDTTSKSTRPARRRPSVPSSSGCALISDERHDRAKSGRRHRGHETPSPSLGQGCSAPSQRRRTRIPAATASCGMSRRSIRCASLSTNG
jgi:chloramphenicol 3-O-phosphotransferase